MVVGQFLVKELVGSISRANIADIGQGSGCCNDFLGVNAYKDAGAGANVVWVEGL